MHTKHTSKALALLLTIAIALTAAVSAFAAAPESALAKALDYLDGKKASLVFGSTSDQSDWKAFALARGGKAIPETYLVSAADAVKAEELGQSTDYARAVLVLTAMGYNAGNFAGCNLLEPLTDINFVKENLPNGPSFALLALNSHSAYAGKIPGGYDLELVDVLLGEYTALGWSAGAVSGVDIDATAMALQALAPYYGIDKVKAKVDAALLLLAGEQFATGGFGPDWGEWGHFEDSCSTAQVVTALSALGLDAAGYFSKDALKALLGFQEANGGFDAALGENPFADAQATHALEAYTRYKENAKGLFDMRDTALSVYGEKTGNWLDKLPDWLGAIRNWEPWIQAVVYYVFFGWIWDVIR